MNRPLRTAALFLVAGLVAGCASTPEREAAPVDEDVTLPGDRARSRMEEEPIGLFLRQLNNDIRAWTQLTMTARSDEERRKARLLTQVLARQTSERIDELIAELDSGPRPNRIVAASALGFAQDRRALSPLLAALEDPEVEVRSNALLALRLLALEETPLERICELMRFGDDDWVRSNAASCISTLVGVGSRSDCVLAAARQGLQDPEPVVRSHSALTLATLLDTSSLGELSDLLHGDEIPLVRSAAMRSLAYIGHEDPPSKADAAKSLVGAYRDAHGTERTRLLAALRQLSERDWGDDEDEWTDWAKRLQ